MTALAFHVSHYPQLSWPRVGAWSGSISLHLVILAMLLTPPVALQVIRRAEVEPRVRIIEPEVVKPEPPLPITPIKRNVQTPVIHREPPPVQLTNEHTDLPIPTQATPNVAPNNNAIADIIETAPSAIGYDKQTRVPYPKDALMKREQGTVILRVLVGADGMPQTVEIKKSSGSRSLDRAALDAVRRWSFHAAMRNGVALAAWAEIPITFNLMQL